MVEGKMGKLWAASVSWRSWVYYFVWLDGIYAVGLNVVGLSYLLLSMRTMLLRRAWIGN